MTFLGFSEKAAILVDKLAHTADVYVIIDDDGCCGFSNIFVRSGNPGTGEWTTMYKRGKVHVLVHPRFEETVAKQNLYIDAVDSPSDDSFSDETKFGMKLLLRRLSARSRAPRDVIGSS